MNKFFKKYIFPCLFIFSTVILIPMDAGMPENDVEKQIEYLKEHPEKIDAILAKKQWYHNCCTPSREISLAEQARDELILDQKRIATFKAEKINQQIQEFKPYVFNWLNEDQIKLIRSNNFTPKIIGLFNLKMMNNITDTQFAGLKANQAKNLIDRYQSLIPGNDSLKYEKLIQFINKFKINTQNESVINELNTITTELLYNRIKNDQASIQELTSLTDNQAIDLINYYQSHMDTAHEQSYNQFLNLMNTLEKNNDSEQIVATINRIKTKLLYTRIKNNQVSSQELANLTPDQTTDLITYYKDQIQNSHHQNYHDLLNFINELQKNSSSQAVRSETNRLKITSIYSKLTDDDITNSQVFTKDHLTAIISKLENFDLDYLMKHSKSEILKKITRKQLNRNFSKNIQKFPAEYIKYINISTLEPFDIKYLESDQIQALKEKQIKNLEKDQLEAFSSDQIKALKKRQIQVLSTDQLKILYDHKSVSYFTKEQIEALTLDQIKNLSIPLLDKLTPQQIGFFTPEQVQAFKPSWFKELTFNTFNALTEEQLKAFKKGQIQSILDRINVLLSIKRINEFNQAFEFTQNILNKIIKSHQSSLEIMQLTNNFYLSLYEKLDSLKFAMLSDENKESIIKFINNLDIIKFTSFISSCLSDKIFDLTESTLIEKLSDPNYYNDIVMFIQSSQAFQNFLNSLNENRINTLLLSLQEYSLHKLNSLSLNSLLNIYIFYKALHKTFINSLKIQSNSIQKYFISPNIQEAFIHKFKEMNQADLSNFIKQSDHMLSSIAYDVYQSRFKKTALS